ncbi:unnamed protein product [Lampetra planeri]
MIGEFRNTNGYELADTPSYRQRHRCRVPAGPGVARARLQQITGKVKLERECEAPGPATAQPPLEHEGEVSEAPGGSVAARPTGGWQTDATLPYDHRLTLSYAA